MVTDWIFEETSTAVSGAAGNLAKLFKNEAVKTPGIMAFEAPTANATIVAREVIQNSWDAARELQNLAASKGIETPRFSIDFEFRDLIGIEKKNFIEAFGLNSLGERAVAVDDDIKLGLGHDSVLKVIHDDSPLRVLYIHESSTTGMYGSFEKTTSKLYLAMLSVGYTKKMSGAGGSYGYGKAGLIRASRAHSVFAYTETSPLFEDEEGVSRRALGVTYWGQHELGPNSYTGFARKGKELRKSIVPLINDEADELAVRLGIASRSGNPGTTFVLPCTDIDPIDLLHAIERNWWPALIDRLMSISVILPDGSKKVPRPRTRGELVDFIRAYELAKDDSAVSEPHERTVTLRRGAADIYGRIALLSDTAGWSFETSLMVGDSIQNHCSLIALTRGPRMVVEYYAPTESAPHVRGVFIADRSQDDLLRETEPKAHDAWETKDGGSGDVRPRALLAAENVMKSIKKDVMDFRKSLNPQAPRDDTPRLREFEDQLKKFFKGTIAPPPPPFTRIFSISVNQNIRPSVDHYLQVEGATKIRFSDRVELGDRESARIRISLSIAVLELGGGSRDHLPLRVDALKGFNFVDDPNGRVVLEGNLRIGQEIEVPFASAAYPPDWSVKVVAAAEMADRLSDSDD